MRAALLLSATLLISGCAPPSLVDGVGFEFGRRYAWSKPGADDVARRRAIFICGAAEEGDLRGALMAQSIPFFGLASLAATVPTVQTIAERRARCMEADGWTLVDIVSGAPQQIRRNAWGDPTPTPRASAP
jgi:hypothetical protein